MWQPMCMIAVRGLSQFEKTTFVNNLFEPQSRGRLAVLSFRLRLFLSQHSLTGFPDIVQKASKSEFCSIAQQPFRDAGMADLSDFPL